MTLGYNTLKISSGAFSGCDNIENTYYRETPQRWNEIDIGQYNEGLTRNVIFVKFTRTNISEDGKEFTVTPVNVDEGKTVVLALYKGDILIQMKSAIYQSEELPFEADEEYDTIKVMVWEEITNLEPITKPEIIR